MTEFKLTARELIVANTLIKECLNNMGGTRPIDLDKDPYTWVSVSDLTNKGYSKHEASGFFSSLSEKGFLEEPEPKVWAITEDGYRWLDTVWKD